MKIKLVVDDTSSPPVCDRPGCGEPWPGASGRELPGGYRLAGRDDIGRLIVRLFCSDWCAEADSSTA